MHRLIGSDEEISKQSSHKLHLSQIILGLSVQKFKRVHHACLLVSQCEFFGVLWIASLEQGSVQAKIQMRVLDNIHELDCLEEVWLVSDDCIFVLGEEVL